MRNQKKGIYTVEDLLRYYDLDSIENKLDSMYKTGSWTPNLIGGTSGSATCDIQNGHYMKAGKTVFAWFRVRTSSKNTLSGYVRLSGLPIAASSSTVNGSAVAIIGSGVTYSNGNAIFAQIVPGETFMYIRVTTVSSGTFGLGGIISDYNIANITEFRGILMYEID